MARGLLIIDYQNDFIPPGGALAVDGGDEIVGRINELARSGGFDLVVATRDWHPPDHHSFTEQGGPWPVHCVRDTPGAELHRDLDASAIDAIVDAGREREQDGYSGFEDTELAELLRAREVDEVTVVGLATDYCVKHTALDALREGLAVAVDTSAVRGVNVEAGDAQRALDQLRNAGARIL